MKEKLTLQIILSLLIIFPLVSADIPYIPENSHFLSRCVEFVNLNDFSDVVLIGYSDAVDGADEAYKIENNNCLHKRYKFDTFDIYWVTKEEFNSLDLKNLNPADLTLLLGDVEIYGEYIEDSNPLMRDDIEYSIAEYSNGKLIIYKSKQTFEYSNGSVNVLAFDKPIVSVATTTTSTTRTTTTTTPTTTIPTPETQEIKKSFWNLISCFFKRLFGGSC